jgi:Ca2+-binding RTX toxin-like protein
MASYAFETITSAQAEAYSAAGDDLSFQLAGDRGATTTVLFGATSITVVSGLSGQSKAFGLGLAGERVAFADGSILYVGTTLGDAPTGGAGADGLYGGQGPDTMSGLGGDDLLQGNAGDDNLSGGDGGDTIYGGQQDDIIAVGTGVNFAQGNLGNDTVDAAAEPSLSANTLLGGQGDDRIFGSGGDEFLNGNLGNDTVAGGDGADRIFGEGANDIVRGDAGGDTLDGGDGDDQVQGGAGDDVLLGGVGGAGGGADTLVGGQGLDRMTGGGGSDRFSFLSGDSGTTEGRVDQIFDWEETDQLAFGIGAAVDGVSYVEQTAASYAAAVALVNPLVASGINYIVVQVGADLFVFTDTNGVNGVADDAIQLVGRSLADISASNVVS